MLSMIFTTYTYSTGNTLEYRVVAETGARFQWENDGGYCGSVSVQIAGLKMGFWMSQDQGRKIAGGEVLLGSNMDSLLNALKLNYTNYNGPNKSGVADRENYLQWIQDAMQAENLVIVSVKTNDLLWRGDLSYDHIMAINAVDGHSKGYYGSDIIKYSDGLDGLESTTTFNNWRDGWNDSSQYYFLPEKKQYGVKIFGMAGDDETHPIYLTVDNNSEPNVSQGANPVFKSAIVHMDNLVAGTTYTLLRWDVDHSTVSAVPTDNILASSSPSNVELEFTSAGSSNTHNVSFISNGISIFKLVEGCVGDSSKILLE